MVERIIYYLFTVNDLCSSVEISDEPNIDYYRQLLGLDKLMIGYKSQA